MCASVPCTNGTGHNVGSISINVDGNVQSGDGTTVFLSTVLAFFTGTESVPLLGFKEQFKLRFLFGDEQKFVPASTCDFILRIPTCHKTYMKNLRSAYCH